mgnify:CR=1 FL=1
MAIDQQEKHTLMEDASEMARQAQLIMALLSLEPVPLALVRGKSIVLAKDADDFRDEMHEAVTD